MFRLSPLPLLVILAWLVGAGGVAAEPETVRLWDQSAPLATGQEEKDQPKLLVYLPPSDNATGMSVVICPGGGYGNLAMDHEGHQIARWLNSFGVAGAILDYRHRGKGYGHPAPMLDVQRAIRTVRHRAPQWKLDPQRVGVMGFSAGGHLASTAATHFDHGDTEAQDPVDRLSCRPSFAILCYPVIAFDQPYTHRGSQRNLLGDDADAQLVRLMSNEQQVTAETPPTFLWHTAEDKGVPPENSIVFFMALRRAGVDGELHVFQRGRHGVGLAADIPGTSRWPELCRTWLEQLK